MDTDKGQLFAQLNRLGVDAVEVVRCKFCISYSVQFNSQPKVFGVCHLLGSPMDPTSYCNSGTAPSPEFLPSQTSCKDCKQYDGGMLCRQRVGKLPRSPALTFSCNAFEPKTEKIEV